MFPRESINRKQRKMFFVFKICCGTRAKVFLDVGFGDNIGACKTRTNSQSPGKHSDFPATSIVSYHSISSQPRRQTFWTIFDGSPLLSKQIPNGDREAMRHLKHRTGTTKKRERRFGEEPWATSIKHCTTAWSSHTLERTLKDQDRHLKASGSAPVPRIFHAQRKWQILHERGHRQGPPKFSLVNINASGNIARRTSPRTKPILALMKTEHNVNIRLSCLIPNPSDFGDI